MFTYNTLWMREHRGSGTPGGIADQTSRLPSVSSLTIGDRQSERTVHAE
jgi:hypothetical protein